MRDLRFLGITILICFISIAYTGNELKAQSVTLPEQCDCDTAYLVMDTLLVIGDDTIQLGALVDSLETLTTLECQDSFLLYTAEDGLVDTINLKPKIDSFETLTVLGTARDSLFYVDENRDTTKVAIPLVDADFFNFRTDMPPTDITDTIYTLNNVGIGVPIPLGILHVNSEDSRDAVFSRFINDPTNDMDLDIVRGFGSTALPIPVTSDGIRLGGVRYRTFVNPLAANPLDAFGVSGEVAAETDGVPSLTSSPGQIIIGTTPQGALRPVDRITIRQSGLVGINESDPTNRLHVVDAADPLRLEGVQEQSTDSILFITGEGVVKYGSVDSFDTTNDAWINLPDSQRIELSTLSDGTTPRTDATSRFYVRDDGKLVYGDDLSTGIGGENDNSGFVNIRRNTGFASLKLMATEGQATYSVESYNDIPARASTLRFFRGRGVDSDDFSTQANVQENDRVGQFEFLAYNNNTSRPAERMSNVAAIRAEVDAPVVDDNNGIPGRISFHTTGGGAFPIERMVIRSNGRVGIGTDDPSNRLHVRAGQDPLRLEGVQNQPTDSILFITGEGVVKYGSIDSFDTTNDAWINLPDSQRIELSTLSDGTTPRTDATSRFYMRDDGKLIIGDDLSTGIGGEEDNSGFINIRRSSGAAALKLSASDGPAVAFLESYSSNNAGTGPVLRFFRGRGTDSDDFSTQVNVQNGDRIGDFQFWGYNNNDDRPAERMSFSAAIRIEVDGTVTDGKNGLPSRMEFFTSDGSTGTPRERMVIKNDGNVGIGTSAPNQLLEVNGGNILVTGGSFIDDGTTLTTPDFVFQKYFDGVSPLKEDYRMMSLKEIEDFVREHKHLPGIQSHEEAKENGWNLSKANRDNLEKIEELFLHSIEMKKQLEEQNEKLQKKDKKISELESQLNALLKRVEALENN